ncbi:hypothetical protein BC828DRAFT_391846 [Blastocladiella britannica]|nr:hypothetical protein BC828DRAFT_391846 [Blastocladiella britannica]
MSRTAIAVPMHPITSAADHPGAVTTLPLRASPSPSPSTSSAMDQNHQAPRSARGRVKSAPVSQSTIRAMPGQIISFVWDDPRNAEARAVAAAAVAAKSEGGPMTLAARRNSTAPRSLAPSSSGSASLSLSLPSATVAMPEESSAVASARRLLSSVALAGTPDAGPTSPKSSTVPPPPRAASPHVAALPEAPSPRAVVPLGRPSVSLALLSPTLLTGPLATPPHSPSAFDVAALYQSAGRRRSFALALAGGSSSSSSVSPAPKRPRTASLGTRRTAFVRGHVASDSAVDFSRAVEEEVVLA